MFVYHFVIILFPSFLCISSTAQLCCVSRDLQPYPHYIFLLLNHYHTVLRIKRSPHTAFLLPNIYSPMYLACHSPLFASLLVSDNIDLNTCFANFIIITYVCTLVIHSVRTLLHFIALSQLSVFQTHSPDLFFLTCIKRSVTFAE